MKIKEKLENHFEIEDIYKNTITLETAETVTKGTIRREDILEKAKKNNSKRMEIRNRNEENVGNMELHEAHVHQLVCYYTVIICNFTIICMFCIALE